MRKDDERKNEEERGKRDVDITGVHKCHTWQCEVVNIDSDSSDEKEKACPYARVNSIFVTIEDFMV